MLILTERHLRIALREYTADYNTQRPHRSLALDPPLPTTCTPKASGRIHAHPVLGGLHHVYEGAA